MGRSKFPGKPSKSINRKRISVLQLEEAADEENSSAGQQQANVNDKSNCDDDHEKGGGGSGGGGRRGGGGASGGVGSSAATASRGVNGNSSSSSSGCEGGGGGGGGGSRTNSSTKTAPGDGCTGGGDGSAAKIDEEAVGSDANLSEEGDNDDDDDDDDDDEEDDDDDDDDDDDEGDEDDDDDDEGDDDEEDDDEEDDVNKAIETRNKNKSRQNADNDNNANNDNNTFSSSGCSLPLKNFHSNKKFKNLIVGKEVMLPSSSKEKHFNCAAPSTSTACNAGIASESSTSSASPGASSSSLNPFVVALEAKVAIGDDDVVNNCDSEKSDNELNNATTTHPSAVTMDVTTKSETEDSTESTTKHKKTVTFKNILETSDDKSAVKKFYNPDNRTPLISIMKKECMNRAMMYSRSSECIVRPSRLTEILKNNSNIDKLNSLKFRSSSSSVSATSSLFGSSLSRAFGAPDQDDYEKQDAITFRVQDVHIKDAKDPAKESMATLTASVIPAAAGTDVQKDENDDEEEEHQIIVDKSFVLPKRSTRSSRVIKPNKRFLDDAVVCKKPNRKPPNNAATNHSKKELVPNNYFGLSQHNDAVHGETSTTKLDLGNKTYKEASESKQPSFALPSASSSLTTTTSSPFVNAFGAASSNPNKFVLRQSRLQFDSTPTGGTALFSSAVSKTLAQSLSSNNTIGGVGTVSNTTSFSLGNSISNTLNNIALNNSSICCVCSTSIHNKNIPQARKYGVLACEACRKFISKITKKSVAANASPTLKSLQLQCKNNGNCIIQPASKVHLKNLKKIYKERCSACWLNRCIQEFQFPSGHKLRLSSILPTSVYKPEMDRTEVALKKELPAALDVISSSNLFATARLNQQNQTQIQPIKWKAASPETSGDCLKINIKSNPLAENNTTFGSSPLIRPAVLEKSMFLKNIMDQQQQQQEDKQSSSAVVADSNDLQKSDDKPAESLSKLKSYKRRDKHDKEKERDTDKEKEKQKDTVKDAKILVSSVVTKDAILSTSSVTPTTTTTILATTTAANTTTPTTNASAVPTVPVTETQKRQRIALKGPRVKHVCRSASVVLGQPLAMFAEEDIDGEEVLENGEEDIIMGTDEAELKETSNEKAKLIGLVTDENDNCSSCNVVPTNPNELQAETTPTITLDKQPPNKTGKIAVAFEQASTKTTRVTVVDDPIPVKKGKELDEKSVALQPLKVTTRQAGVVNQAYALSTVGKKHMRHEPLMQQQQLRRKERPQKLKTMISIDFWENYDPAEVCQTGFGLIITETVAQRALCFLCGSAGLDPLIFCACCCEPYHQYCVLDEYNLKHSSLDETMASVLDVSIAAHSSLVDNFSLMTQRLNWLCPRCTICYTCNMSSGAKVRCQKCQKNYHSTCLGTSKRLLGADRPLICVNCLKCKSCSTTKVSKFVGNLPMCTTCFKLRKKGNYCPICQKCYDDNDFDLKMMECGNCKQWVHSKCEGLSDEQYNLLSTLPESTEFICKKCARRDESAKQKAEELRQAVMEEFKTSLLSVLKLLSKSRQACALLKLSPRKKIRCTCQQAINGRMQPKCLQFIERDSLGSDGESQCSEDIYEFKESSALNEARSKDKCTCLNAYYNKSAPTAGTHLSLVDIKKKICSGKYVSLAEFNYDMNTIIQSSACDELILAYKEILSEQFPWFQNETKACTDALEEDMFESCGAYALNNSLESHDDYQHSDEQDQPAAVDLPEDIDEVIYSLKARTDQRVCLFCRKTGEGLPSDESRLIYCGNDCWAHTNCAMWSAEVFEEIDGSLQNVHSAVSRGRMIKCTVCGTRGATVGCNVKACGEHYHFPCARSIECAFLTDKTVFCPTHAQDVLQSNSAASLETNFEVSRPVYVELDRRRKKPLEPSKVQFHIGSLEVKQLGSIFPKFSDTFEALVPINFLCSRLYWSLKEPWKIVEYTVRTTIQNNYAASYGSLDAEKHFTVDHTNSNASVVGLAQIARWHNSLAARCEFMDFAGIEPAALTTLCKLLPPEYLAHNQCSSSATDENTEEEPQTNADLLPPEIKDAIFEDLPHEILDGISMLDIFPKFMIYEDIVNADGSKSENLFNNEQSKDGATNSTVGTNVNISDEDTVNSSAFSKQLELSNSWSSGGASNIAMGHVEDAMLAASRQAKRGVDSGTQRNKSEILKKNTSSQRAWAKLDGSSVSAIKRRKISKGLQDIRLTEGVLLSLNQTRSTKKESTALAPTTVSAALTRRQSLTVDSIASRAPFTWSAAKRYPYDSTANSKSPEENTSKVKLMQVDGVDDSITEYRIVTSNAQQFCGTVKCDRCHCTYRTYDSFQRHLATCEPLSTSESESETAPRSPEIAGSGSPMMVDHDINKLGGQRASTTAQLHANSAGSLPFIQAFPQAIPIGNLQANINGIPIGVQGLQNMQGLQQLQGLQNIQLQSLPQSLGGNFFIAPATPSSSSADEMHYFSNALQGLTTPLAGNTYTLAPTSATSFGQAASIQQPQLIAVSTNPDGTQQLIQLPTASQQPQHHILQSTNAFQPALHPASNTDKKNVKSQKYVTGAASVTANKSGLAASKQKLKACNSIKPIQSKVTPCTAVSQQSLHSQQQQPIAVFSTAGASNAQLLNQNLLQQMQAVQQQQQQPQILFQTGNTSGQPQPIIMQQLGGSNNALSGNPNIISFVSAESAHNQPQVQYVSIPTVGGNSNPLMQGAFLQSDASGNLVLTTAPHTQQPSTMQMLSATPLNSQPQVIGTIIQPQTLQLGGNVITATDPNTQQQQQLIIGNGATGLEMITAANAAAPQVILTTQPMYYGLETIVQNTVMSSQQFVSTAMPGVLSQNASFSATTTQVFQASKIEPIVDMPTTSYVVLNNVDAGTSIAAQPNYINTTNMMRQQQPQQAQTTPTTEMQQPPHQQLNIIDNLPQQQRQQPAVFKMQTHTNGAASAGLNQLGQQPQNTIYKEGSLQQQPQAPSVQIITAKIPPVAQTKRSNTVKATPVAAVTKVQPQVVNKVMPTSAMAASQLQKQQQQLNQTKMSPQRIAKPLILDGSISVTAVTPEMLQQVFTAATTVAATPVTNNNAAKPLQNVGRKTNMIRPINKAEIKPKIMKISGAANKQQQQYVQQQQQLEQEQQLQSHGKLVEGKAVDYASDVFGEQQNQAMEQNNTQHYIANNALTVNHHNNNSIIYKTHTYEQQQQDQQQNEYLVEVSSLGAAAVGDNNDSLYQLQQQQDMANILPTTNSATSRLQYTTTTLNSNAYNSNVPTNVVTPIQQQQVQYGAATQQNNATSFVSRPTNRVLPMQQRQENIAVTNKAAAATVATKMSPHNINSAKCFETGSSNNKKIHAYENEIRKDQQQLLEHEQHEMQQLAAQSESTAAYEKMLLQQHELQMHAASPKCATTEDMQAMEAESAALTSHQLEIVTDDLQNLAASIICADNQEQQQEDLEPTPGQVLSVMGVGSEENEDEDEDDDEDDDFSLKMPTDADQEISDGDEPAVKEKISKILDNLTNEDCVDVMPTATQPSTPTADQQQPIGAAASYMSASMEEDIDMINQNYKSATSYAVLTAARSQSFQYSSMEPPSAVVSMAAGVEPGPPPVAISGSSDFVNQTKSATQVTLDSNTTTTNAAVSAPIISSSVTGTTQQQTAYKLSSPYYPPRDFQKITGPHLLYEIQSEDGFTYKSTSIAEIWEKVFEAVQVARRAHGLAPLPEGPLADMSGVQMIGLKTNALKYLIEQLPGVEKCVRYTPKYHKRNAVTATSATGSGATASSACNITAATATHSDGGTALLDYCSDQDDLQENPYESVRCEPYCKRSDYDMFSWLASRHRKQPIQVFVQPPDTELIPRRGTGSNLPMAMKYRTLKETYKDYVGVFRSLIHGRGLYCIKDIEAGEMVIEYAGELIRSTLTDKRERNYDSRGIGCYMFKIDENLVVDATMRGNAARFINHSCEPNCYSKVVDILGHKHIIIFALRRIVQGEELTYDYKFPFEDEKIPCSCGSKKCRKYLN